MSFEQAVQSPDAEEKKSTHEKSPSFHVLPNSETLHRVKDPLVLHRDKAESGAEPEAAKEKSPSFHVLPNSETLHRVKDPIKLK